MWFNDAIPYEVEELLRSRIKPMEHDVDSQS